MEITPQSTGPEILAAAERLVIKFGGDNGGAWTDNLQLVLELLSEDKGLALVFSAIRSSAIEAARFSLFREGKESLQFNTTSHLIQMAKAAQDGDEAAAAGFLEAVRGFTHWSLKGVPDSAQRCAMEAIVDAECAAMASFIKDAVKAHPATRSARFFQQGMQGRPVDYMFAPDAEGHPLVSFTGFGEKLAEKLYTFYLDANGVKARPLDAESLSQTIFGDQPLEAMERKGNIVNAVREGLTQRIATTLMDGEVLVTGGRLPGAAEGRGYSDVAAVLLAQAMVKNGDTPLVWIAKQGPIESIDPKLLSEPDRRKLVQRSSRDLAIEFFDPNGADAGAFHPDAAKLLTEGMNVVVGNPIERGERLSWISVDHRFLDRRRVEGVAFKTAPHVVVVSGGDMVDRPGVLERIMQRFIEVSVGHVHTDAGSILFTCNEAPKAGSVLALREELREAFGDSYVVREVSGQAWVFCLGNNIAPAQKAVIYQVFDKLGIDEACATASPLVFKVLVPEGQAKDLTIAFHNAFFSHVL